MNFKRENTREAALAAMRKNPIKDIIELDKKEKDDDIIGYYDKKVRNRVDRLSEMYESKKVSEEFKKGDKVIFKDKEYEVKDIKDGKAILSIDDKDTEVDFSELKIKEEPKEKDKKESNNSTSSTEPINVGDNISYKDAIYKVKKVSDDKLAITIEIDGKDEQVPAEQVIKVENKSKKENVNESAASLYEFPISFSDFPEFIQSILIGVAKGQDITSFDFKIFNKVDDKSGKASIVFMSISDPDNIIKTEIADPNEMTRIQSFVAELTELDSDESEDIDGIDTEDSSDMEDEFESVDEAMPWRKIGSRRKRKNPMLSRKAKKAAKSAARKIAFKKAMAKFRKSAKGKKLAKAIGKYRSLRASVDVSDNTNSIVDSIIYGKVKSIDEAISSINAGKEKDIAVVKAVIAKLYPEDKTKQEAFVNSFISNNISEEEFLTTVIEYQMIMDSEDYKDLYDEALNEYNDEYDYGGDEYDDIDDEELGDLDPEDELDFDIDIDDTDDVGNIDSDVCPVCDDPDCDGSCMDYYEESTKHGSKSTKNTIDEAQFLATPEVRTALNIARKAFTSVGMDRINKAKFAMGLIDFLIVEFPDAEGKLTYLSKYFKAVEKMAIRDRIQTQKMINRTK